MKANCNEQRLCLRRMSRFDDCFRKKLATRVEERGDGTSNGAGYKRHRDVGQ